MVDVEENSDSEDERAPGEEKQKEKEKEKEKDRSKDKDSGKDKEKDSRCVWRGVVLRAACTASKLASFLGWPADACMAQ